MSQLRKAVRRVMRRYKGLQAPGHCHTVPGRWDGDAKHPAGSVCKRCRDWAELRGLL